MAQTHSARALSGNIAIIILEPEIESWRGEKPLWIVFWIYGVVRFNLIVACCGVALAQGHVALEQMLLLFIAVYAVWLFVSLWRCARRCTSVTWSVMARNATVVWTLNTVILVGFIQLDLIKVYVGATSLNGV